MHFKARRTQQHLCPTPSQAQSALKAQRVQQHLSPPESSEAFHGFHSCLCVSQSSRWQSEEQYLALRHKLHKLPLSTGSWQNQHERKRPFLSLSIATVSWKHFRHPFALTNRFLPFMLSKMSRSSAVALLRTRLNACTSSFF